MGVRLAPCYNARSTFRWGEGHVRKALVPTAARLPVILLAILPPDGLPAYIDGGKTIVTVADDAVWTVDVKTKAAARWPVAKDWSIRQTRMVGDQLWVECQQGDLRTHSRFDPVTRKYSSGTDVLDTTKWLEQAKPIAYEGKKCVLVAPTDTDSPTQGKVEYDAFSFPELKKIEPIELHHVVPAGGFWWLDRTFDNTNVYNAEGKRVATIARKELDKALDEDRCRYAQIADDGKTLFVASAGKFTTFGIFDVEKGTYLWGGGTEIGECGIPLVKRTEVWYVTGGGRGVCLSRFAPPTKEEPRFADYKQVLDYPLPDKAKPTNYAPSPDGSRMLVTVSDGTHAQILSIPLREGVKEKDVEVVELKESK